MQEYHCEVTFGTGEPVQVPGVAVRTPPTNSSPEMEIGSVFTGACLTTAAGAAAHLVVPTAVVTAAVMYLPT